MSLYVDSNAPQETAGALLRSDPSLLTARHTVVEVRRNLARVLDGPALAAAREAFAHDLEVLSIVDLRQAQAARAFGFTVVGV